MKYAIERMASQLDGEADFAIIHVWIHLPSSSAAQKFLAWNRANFRRPVLAVEHSGQRYNVKLA